MYKIFNENDNWGVVNNERYKSFNQLIYTAGDEQQFIELFESGGNVYKNGESQEGLWDGFKNINSADVLNTFKYIFNKFKKGIYVKIFNGRIEIFLPFSKHKFINEWSHLIKHDPSKYNSLLDFLLFVNKQNGYKFDVKKISTNPLFWYANNCLVRYEHPISENETNISTIKHMIQSTCENRNVNNCEFFINKRDFPLITKNYTEPYNHIYGDGVLLKSFKFDKYCPIMSMCGDDTFADIIIPTHEDWARVCSIEDKLIFNPQKKIYIDLFNLVWENKKNIAIFRGASTGHGTTCKNNMRLAISKMSFNGLFVENKNGEKIVLDAGITKWNTRPRKIKDNIYLQTIDISSIGFPLSPKMSPEEQSNCKFIINLDGHVSAFRLSLEMSMGSCILKTETNWKMWFFNKLIPYQHYIPLKENLSDLHEKLQWCLENDQKCKIIAENALNFYKTNLNKEKIMDYMENIINKSSGNYTHNYISREKLSKDNLDNCAKLDFSNFENLKKYETIPEYNTAIVSDYLRDENNISLYENRKDFGYLRAYELFLSSKFINTRKLKGSENTQSRLLGVFEKEIFSNKNTSVNLYKIYGNTVAQKILKTSDKNKFYEQINEIYISKFFLNSVIEEVPNFCYNFYGEETLRNLINYSEYIVGDRMVDLMDFKNIKIKNFIEIFIQISTSIAIAQNHCKFAHNDLTPWNVIVQTSSKPVEIEYILKNEKFKILTKHVAVIIDYGKSTAQTSYNSLRDVFIFLVTSTISIFEKKSFSKEIQDFFIYLWRFFDPTIENINQISLLCQRYNTYSNLFDSVDSLKINTNIYDFINYLKEKSPQLKIIFNKSQKNKKKITSNTFVILDQFYKENVKSSVNKIFENLFSSPLHQPKSLLEKYYCLVYFTNLFDSLEAKYNSYINMKDFSQSKNFIINFYENLLDYSSQELITDNYDETQLIKYKKIINQVLNFKNIKQNHLNIIKNHYKNFIDI